MIIIIVLGKYNKKRTLFSIPLRRYVLDSFVPKPGKRNKYEFDDLL